LAPSVYSQSELDRPPSPAFLASRFFLYVTAITMAPTQASAPKMIGRAVAMLEESPVDNPLLLSFSVSTEAVEDLDDAVDAVAGASVWVSALLSDDEAGPTVAVALEGASVVSCAPLSDAASASESVEASAAGASVTLVVSDAALPITALLEVSAVSVMVDSSRVEIREPASGESVRVDCAAPVRASRQQKPTHQPQRQ
jgi:hypothetical protein